ncbi:uncharacterized protein LOC112554242 isoform X2 [Pomacea canaliculata]|uniref:uncharacterized protein LOC112554242 isoform X2 n=1 Tax=Pomacea canaliculata TaxID=400727 RepID=UPI000D7349BC|nr:uncharacterized protein LOC112554242 isoform X2 [Pomacea canaliculata]XP_025077723.1 uncharacterized protein LOC112554242 isoform X2 [Pomacea canaliculata]XP_025077724.1 uncharacterized protein LOC112554242 isoform X2 [Pomacea canaliculata]
MSSFAVMGSGSIFVLLILLEVGRGQNLLRNPSFEGDLRGSWDNNGFTMERVSGDTVDGRFALKASARDRETEGPLQTLATLKPNGRYEMSVYVKLLNDINGKVWQSIKVNMQFHFTDKDEIGSYFIATRNLVSASMGWIQVNGSLSAPVRAFNWVRIAIRGPDAGVNFMVDKATLYEIPENTNWFADSQANIDKYRKSNANIRFSLPAGVPASVFDVQVTLKKHSFLFGGKAKDTLIAQQPINEYSKLFYYMFNWGAVQSYKWKYDKGTRTSPDFGNALSATDALRANGLKVRGHSIFWDVQDNIPPWVLALSGKELRDELDKHLLYMCNITRGKLEHIDVQNEHTHGLYYEQKLQDKNITKNFYRKMRACDNTTKLFFNDYQAIDIGPSTEEYYQLMKEYLAEGVPVHGLGVQGHTKLYMIPDPTMMWRRADRLGMLGIDIVMSEFDVQTKDPVQRADWVENVMRACFSHPAITGIVYWSFWDLDAAEPDKELIKGNSLTIIEPGQRFICLLKKEWTTNVVRNLASGLNLAFRGFMGDYEVVVRRSGVPIQVERFTLVKAGASVDIKITSSTTAVPVVQERDYVPRCVSHRDQAGLGQKSTSSFSRSLFCNNVVSEPSGASEDEEATAMCAPSQVMTGCSSFQNYLQWTRKGEKIVIENGVVKCKAYNGRNSPTGVRAMARCCSVSGLTCDYRVAGPSFPFNGAQAEAVCPLTTTPLGCSSYSRYPDMDGAYANSTANSCVAQSGNPTSSNPAESSGSTAFAACCSAPGMSCIRVSTPMTSLAAGNQQYVSCPYGYTMTSCDYFAADGRAAGAGIVEANGSSYCVAVMGDNLPAGSKGVVGTASCCSVPF